MNLLVFNVKAHKTHFVIGEPFFQMSNDVRLFRNGNYYRGIRSPISKNPSISLFEGQTLMVLMPGSIFANIRKNLMRVTAVAANVSAYSFTNQSKQSTFFEMTSSYF